MNDMMKKGLQKSMQLCSQREKCAKDIRLKLHQWDIDESYHEEIVNKLFEENFLNDFRYASSFVNDKIYLSKWGKQKVFYALTQKNIPENIINKAIDNIDEEKYTEQLVNLLSTKNKSIKANSDYEKMGKLIRYGQSRGFTMSEVNEALNEIL